MAENLSIESPDFLRIRKGDSKATENAVRLLWFVLNDELASRRRGVRAAKDLELLKVLTIAPTANQDNLDMQGSGVLLINTTSSVNITGFRGQGVEGERITIHNIGSGTITVPHESGSSEAENRVVTASGASKSVTTNKSLMLHYLNARWRELSLA